MAKKYLNPIHHSNISVSPRNSQVSKETVDATADLIVGSDGAFSAVRRNMLHFPGFDFNQTYIEHGYLELCIPPIDGEVLSHPRNLVFYLLTHFDRLISSIKCHPIICTFGLVGNSWWSHCRIKIKHGPSPCSCHSPISTNFKRLTICFNFSKRTFPTQSVWLVKSDWLPTSSAQHRNIWFRSRWAIPQPNVARTSFVNNLVSSADPIISTKVSFYWATLLMQWSRSMAKEWMQVSRIVRSWVNFWINIVKISMQRWANSAPHDGKMRTQCAIWQCTIM